MALLLACTFPTSRACIHMSELYHMYLCSTVYFETCAHSNRIEWTTSYLIFFDTIIEMSLNSLGCKRRINHVLTDS